MREHEIPLGARIIFVCDAYDAMTTDRSYRKSVGHEEAIRRLRDAAGTQFDPVVVESFIAMIGSPEEPRAASRRMQTVPSLAGEG